MNADKVPLQTPLLNRPERGELHDPLKSHTSASVGRKYGSGVPLEVLAEAVAKVNYKGLDLTHLHVTEPGTT